MCNEYLLFLFLNQNICCEYLKGQSQWDGCFEHSKHSLKLIGQKIFTTLRWHFLFLKICVLLFSMNFWFPVNPVVLFQCWGIFWCTQGPKFGPIPNGIQVTDFFPNFEKKSQSLIIIIIFFFLKLGFSFSLHTHKLHGDVLLQFNGNSIRNS